MTDPRHVLRLDEAAHLPRAVIGGKATGLAVLAAAEVRVPATVVVPATVLDAMLDDGSPDDARQHCIEGPVPQGFPAAVNRALSSLVGDQRGSDGVIVRSSSPDEDHGTARAPGIFASVRAGATGSDVMRAIRQVWASAFAPTAIAYRQRRGVAEGRPRMAVLLQPYIDAGGGGVLYTLEPTTRDPSSVVVSWSDEGPEAVAARGEADRSYVVAKGDVEARSALPPAVGAMTDVALRIERQVDDAIDIEFAVADDGRPVALQLRKAGYTPPWRESTALWTEIREEHRLRSGKIVALRTAVDDFEREIELQVLRPPAFERFIRSGRRIPDDFRAALAPMLDRFVRQGPVSLRPAYWSGLNSGDNLPQSAPLSSVEDCVDHAVRVWGYVLDNELDDYSAEVAVICGNWITPRSTVVASATPHERGVELAVTAGYPEGLEHLPHEQHVIDTHAGTVAQVTPLEQRVAILEPGGGPAPLAPAERRLRMPSSAQLVALGRSARRIAEEIGGPARVEFLLAVHPTSDEVSPLVWQIDPVGGPTTGIFSISTAGESPLPRGDVVYEGPAEWLENLDEHEPPDDPRDSRLLLIDLARLGAQARERPVEVAQHLAASRAPVVVQTSALSHFASLLREFEVAFWPVPAIPLDIDTGTCVAVRRAAPDADS